jgi:pimeloyl-ACP methyl ester carboxylesterase
MNAATRWAEFARDPSRVTWSWRCPLPSRAGPAGSSRGSPVEHNGRTAFCSTEGAAIATLVGVAGIEYARVAAGSLVAYREVGGSGPPIVYVSGAMMPIEVMQEDPVNDRFLQGLAALGRLFVFDRRGIGASDPPDWDRPLIPQWVDDALSVLDVLGLSGVTLVGHEAGASVALGVAARAPDRVTRLALLHGPAGDAASWRKIVDEWQARMAAITARDVDEGALLLREAMPSRADDPAFRAWIDRAGRVGASPATAGRIWNAVFEASRGWREFEFADIQAPTLVLHRADCRIVPVSGSRSLAERLPNGRLVMLPGADYTPYSGDVEALLAEITAFVAGDYQASPPDRPMLALLFTDLVGSTERAAASGDAAWSGMLSQHDELVGAAIGRHGGTLVKTTGDGTLATFATASRALSGAIDLRSALEGVGLAVRMGVHVGEVVLREHDVVGLSVHVAARIMDEAGPGDVFVSGTVASVAAGGPHHLVPVRRGPLRGLDGEWEIFALE